MKALRNGWDYVLSLWENLRRLPFNTLYLRFHTCQMRKFTLVSFYRDIVRLKETDVPNDFLKMVRRISSFLTHQILSGTIAHSQYHSRQFREVIPIFRQGPTLGGVPAARMPDDPPPCSFRGSWAWFNIWTYAYVIIYITVQRRIWRRKNKRVVYPKEDRTSSSWSCRDARCLLYPLLPAKDSASSLPSDWPPNTLCSNISAMKLQKWVGRWNEGEGFAENLQAISRLP